MIIVCFSSVPWDGLRQRHQQIMSRLAKKNHKIVYVEPTNILEAIKKPNMFFNRVKIIDDIILVTPLFFPLHHKIKLFEKIDLLISSHILNKILNNFGLKEVDVVWSFSPYFNFIIPSIKKYKILVYDCADESEGFHSSEHGKTWILNKEKQILAKSDLVFVTSDRLHEKCIEFNSNVCLAPNGVPAHFFDSTDKISIPTDMEKIRHPIIGYVGSLADWLDYEALYDVAMNNDNYSFVFVGPINTDNLKLKNLQSMKNVYFVGTKKHRDIPAYINQFDVCLIPFKIQDLTQSSQPIKLFEYFALGKPVISSRLSEIEKFEEFVHITNENDFSEKIKNALCEDSFELSMKRKKIAKQYDWDGIVEIIDYNLISLMNK